VTLLKRLQMMRIYSYLSEVRGNGRRRSMAKAAKGSVAGRNHMCAVLCIPISRLFPQMGRYESGILVFAEDPRI